MAAAAGAGGSLAAGFLKHNTNPARVRGNDPARQNEGYLGFARGGALNPEDLVALMEAEALQRMEAKAAQQAETERIAAAIQLALRNYPTTGRLQ